MRRFLAAVLLLAAIAALVVITWPQLFGLQRTMWVAQVVSLRGLGITVAVVLLVAITLLSMLSRGFRRFGSSFALLLLVFALAGVAILATRGFGSGTFQKKGSSDLVIMSWNTLGDAPGADVIAKVAVDSGADVIALPETTRQTADAVAAILKQDGHPMQSFTVSLDQVSKARSTSLLVSTSLGGYHVDKESGSTSQLPSFVARPDDGTGPAFVAVHVVSPVPGQFTKWAADLAWTARSCNSNNVIMAGDFNATLDHFTGLEATDADVLGLCSDAAQATKNAAVGTWPAFLPPLLGAPIDHVMATASWEVTGMRVVQDRDGAGSDHRPIVVQLRPRS